MWVFVKRFCDDVSGATAIEYALIATMIFLAVITTLSEIGSNLSLAFTAVNNGFN